jgi:hypothetical protein
MATTIDWRCVAEDLEISVRQAHAHLDPHSGNSMRALTTLESCAGRLPPGGSWTNEINTQYKRRAEMLAATSRMCAGWVGAGTNREAAQRMLEKALAGELDDPPAAQAAAGRPAAPRSPVVHGAARSPSRTSRDEEAEAHAIATAGGKNIGSGGVPHRFHG